MKMNNRIITILLTCLLGFIPFSASFGAEKPGRIVVAKIDQGLKVLNDPALQGMDKFSERRQKLWEIVSSVFDFEETSKRAMGRYWLKLTDREKKDFTESFVAILKNFYLEKSDSYQGEKIEYRREVVKGNRAKVQTIVFTVNKKEVTVDLSMHRTDDLWKIYDLTIEGVSIVSNYRSQFRSIIARSSFVDLMEKLQEKSDEISN